MFPNAEGISVTLTLNVALTYAGMAISSTYAKLGNAAMAMELLCNAYKITGQCQ